MCVIGDAVYALEKLISKALHMESDSDLCSVNVQFTENSVLGNGSLHVNGVLKEVSLYILSIYDSIVEDW